MKPGLFMCLCKFARVGAILWIELIVCVALNSSKSDIILRSDLIFSLKVNQLPLCF